MSFTNGQNEPERPASRPPRSPAIDRSWHGNDAQARSATPERSAAVSEATSPTIRWVAPQLAAYDAAFPGSMSLAKRHIHPGPRPARAMPPPQKNS
jgi:hypothetical protein